MATISIVVPVYNVENYLPQCIDSIRCQTFDDFEVICVVDGATDRSEALLSLFKLVEPRLKVVVKKNGGLSSARNAGIEQAAGEYVMFVDSDDMLTPDACKVVYDTFQKTGAEVVTFGAWCYPRFASTPWHDVVLSPRDVFYDEFSPDILFKEQSHPFAWRTAVSLEFIKRTGLRFDESTLFAEDQVFHFALYPKAKGVAFISKKLYEYRLFRRGSLMEIRFAEPLMRLEEHIVVADLICKNWKADGLMEAYGNDISTWVSEFLFPDCLSASDEDRCILAPKLRNLFKTHFSVEALQSIDDSSPFKPVCMELVSSSSEGDIPNETRLLFLGAVNGANVDDDTEREMSRSALKDKLRTVLPMSAAGLEYRLANLGTGLQSLKEASEARGAEQIKLSAEQLNWVVEEAGACTRSLALLQCELLAKKL